MANVHDAIVDFLFECGILSKTPRSFHHFLGTGHQSVAEHINRTMYVCYALASMRKGVRVERMLMMCLFHDFAEGRTSDLNYVHQKYVVANEKKAIKELTDSIPFGAGIHGLLDEYSKRRSVEAKLARDADQLELILSLKEQLDLGNSSARRWFPSALKRLKTPEAKTLAKKILRTDSSRWWIGDEHDAWWVNRNAATLKKRF